MKNQMHTWVNELMGTWLEQVYDPELLDDWIYQIEMRKKALGIIGDDKLIEKLKRGLRDCKRGDIIWTMKSMQHLYKSKTGPLPYQIEMENKPEIFWHRATFLKYQPVKGTLWLEVPWPTGHSYGKKTWVMTIKQDGGILKYQPSRTEYEVRLANKERLQRRP
jgi:hypothetical protein